MFGERHGRYKRTCLHGKMERVVKKASHGIRLRELGADVYVELIMELAGWVRWCTCGCYTMFICVGWIWMSCWLSNWDGGVL